MERGRKPSTSFRQPLRSLPTNVEPIRDNQRKSKIPLPVDAKNVATTSRPAQKTAFIRTLSKRYTKGYEESLNDKLLQDESLEDYIRYLMQIEHKWLVLIPYKSNIVINTFIRRGDALFPRFETVNWLLSLQEHMTILDEWHYATVKMMDYIICTIISSRSKHELRLLSITSLWIVAKYQNASNNFTIHKIMQLLGGKYSKKEILTNERLILKLLNYSVAAPLPSICLEHYLRKTKLINRKLVYNSSYFVLDCLSMMPLFAYKNSSYIAAIAVYTALKVLKSDLVPLLDAVNIDQDMLKKSSQQCLIEINGIKKSNYREPFIKYSKVNKMNVSSYF